MTEKEILELRDLAEVGKVQFKERIVDNYDIACEMCAMSNYQGGRIIIGINDKTGEINPLSFKETQETTQALGNIASTMLNPSILIETDSSKVEGGNLVIASIKEGTNKPYHDNKGIMQFFTRNLRNVQVEENFNSLGELEIPPVALMEFTANALVHRSLVWTMPLSFFLTQEPGAGSNALLIQAWKYSLMTMRRPKSS
jgi:predicted HTH transcriptional regulator